jgi:hypothetical protein
MQLNSKWEGWVAAYSNAYSGRLNRTATQYTGNTPAYYATQYLRHAEGDTARLTPIAAALGWDRACRFIEERGLK